MTTHVTITNFCGFEIEASKNSEEITVKIEGRVIPELKAPTINQALTIAKIFIIRNYRLNLRDDI